jgi:hypothetical protein
MQFEEQASQIELEDSGKVEESAPEHPPNDETESSVGDLIFDYNSALEILRGMKELGNLRELADKFSVTEWFKHFSYRR